MEVKVATATTFLQWASQPMVPHSSSTTAISSPSSKRRRSTAHEGRSLCCRFVPQRLNPSSLFGTHSTKLQRSNSCELWELSKTKRTPSIRRASSASLDSFSDEEFSRKIEELALRFHVPTDEEDEETHKSSNNGSEPPIIHDSFNRESMGIVGSHGYSPKLGSDSVEPPWEEMVHLSSVEMKANSVDLPLSLRIIKRKIRWEEGVREAGGSAYCSVKKAFSSMVFIVRELHSFTLHMRELLFYEDLQGILQRVRKEMHASFVWLFQQVFSHTPTLMVYVMILLANFTVYSIGTNAAMAAAASQPPPTTISELTTVTQSMNEDKTKFDSSSVKTFYVSSSTGKTAYVGSNNGGGGGKVRPITSGTNGDGWSEGSDHFRTIIPDGAPHLSEPSVSGQMNREKEVGLWSSIVEESERMQASTRDESLDHDTMKRFVSPVEARIEADDYTDYFKTELHYQTGLSQEPNNPLLLANYAQFLYLVARDYDRAEEYFKKAAKVEPADAEALSKYATFLWRARNDLWAAEETFLEAISADPTNSYYSANYANFLWNTGGDDTCFPLDAPQEI